MIPPRRRWYRGVHFRSTMEADYAATFDSYGLAWEYEPEAYLVPDGQLRSVAYSPDFRIGAQKLWVEVKGPHGERVDKAESFANLLHTAHESHGIGTFPDEAVLVYGLPAVRGEAVLRPSPCFGNAAYFARCPQCGHLTVCFDDGSPCRVCYFWDDALRKPESVLLCRARDDDPPRAG